MHRSTGPSGPAVLGGPIKFSIGIFLMARGSNHSTLRAISSGKKNPTLAPAAIAGAAAYSVQRSLAVSGIDKLWRVES
jgi:hypothetical protein